MDLPLALIPLRLIGLKLLAALDALIEGAEGMFDGGLRGKHVGVFEEHLAGVRINLDISHQLGLGIFRFQVLHQRCNLAGLLLNLRELFRFGLDRGRRGIASTLTTAACSARGNRLLGDGRLEKHQQSERDRGNQSFHSGIFQPATLHCF